MKLMAQNEKKKLQKLKITIDIRLLDILNIILKSFYYRNQRNQCNQCNL